MIPYSAAASQRASSPQAASVASGARSVQLLKLESAGRSRRAPLQCRGITLPQPRALSPTVLQNEVLMERAAQPSQILRMAPLQAQGLVLSPPRLATSPSPGAPQQNTALTDPIVQAMVAAISTPRSQSCCSSSRHPSPGDHSPVWRATNSSVQRLARAASPAARQQALSTECPRWAGQSMASTPRREIGLGRTASPSPSALSSSHRGAHGSESLQPSLPPEGRSRHQGLAAALLSPRWTPRTGRLPQRCSVDSSRSQAAPLAASNCWNWATTSSVQRNHQGTETPLAGSNVSSISRWSRHTKVPSVSVAVSQPCVIPSSCATTAAVHGGGGDSLSTSYASAAATASESTWYGLGSSSRAWSLPALPSEVGRAASFTTDADRATGPSSLASSVAPPAFRGIPLPPRITRSSQSSPCMSPSTPGAGLAGAGLTGAACTVPAPSSLGSSPWPFRWPVRPRWAMPTQHPFVRWPRSRSLPTMRRCRRYRRFLSVSSHPSSSVQPQSRPLPPQVSSCTGPSAVPATESLATRTPSPVRLDAQRGHALAAALLEEARERLRNSPRRPEVRHFPYIVLPPAEEVVEENSAMPSQHTPPTDRKSLGEAAGKQLLTPQARVLPRDDSTPSFTAEPPPEMSLASDALCRKKILGAVPLKECRAGLAQDDSRSTDVHGIHFENAYIDRPDSTYTELNAMYPIALVINEVADSLLQLAPVSFSSTWTASALKRRLSSLVVKATGGSVARLSREAFNADETPLRDALSDPLTWSAFITAIDKTCSANGVPADLGDRLVSDVQRLLSIQTQPSGVELRRSLVSRLLDLSHQRSRGGSPQRSCEREHSGEQPMSGRRRSSPRAPQQQQQQQQQQQPKSEPQAQRQAQPQRQLKQQPQERQQVLQPQEDQRQTSARSLSGSRSGSQQNSARSPSRQNSAQASSRESSARADSRRPSAKGPGPGQPCAKAGSMPSVQGSCRSGPNQRKEGRPKGLQGARTSSTTPGQKAESTSERTREIQRQSSINNSRSIAADDVPSWGRWQQQNSLNSTTSGGFDGRFLDLPVDAAGLEKQFSARSAAMSGVSPRSPPSARSAESEGRLASSRTGSKTALVGSSAASGSARPQKSGLSIASTTPEVPEADILAKQATEEEPCVPIAQTSDLLLGPGDVYDQSTMCSTPPHNGAFMSPQRSSSSRLEASSSMAASAAAACQGARPHRMGAPAGRGEGGGVDGCGRAGTRSMASAPRPNSASPLARADPKARSAKAATPQNKANATGIGNAREQPRLSSAVAGGAAEECNAMAQANRMAHDKHPESSRDGMSWERQTSGGPEQGDDQEEMVPSLSIAAAVAFNSLDQASSGAHAEGDAPHVRSVANACKAAGAVLSERQCASATASRPGPLSPLQRWQQYQKRQVIPSPKAPRLSKASGEPSKRPAAASSRWTSRPT